MESREKGKDAEEHIVYLFFLIFFVVVCGDGAWGVEEMGKTPMNTHYTHHVFQNLIKNPDLLH